MYKSIDCCYIPAGLCASVIQAEWSRLKVLCCVLADPHASIKKGEYMYKSVDRCYIPAGLCASVSQAKWCRLKVLLAHLLTHMPALRKENTCISQ